MVSELLPSCDCMAADLVRAVVADGSANGREPPRVVLILTGGRVGRWLELGLDANAVNFGVVAVQRFYGGKVVAVVVISMMRSGLIERR